MNKKKDRGLVRNIHYLVRLNLYENEIFKENLAKGNGLKATDFIRQFMMKGYVQAPIQKSEKIEARSLMKLLIGYSTNFIRIANFMKYKDSQLAQEVKKTADSIQKIIDRI